MRASLWARAKLADTKCANLAVGLAVVRIYGMWWQKETTGVRVARGTNKSVHATMVLL